MIPCRLGCTACCYGPFDISPAEAEEVATAVARLPEPLRTEIRQRSLAQLQQMQELLPEWDLSRGLELIDEAHLDAACEALADSPCPALGPDGACTIHGSRPSTCRIMGLGIRTRTGAVLENACPIQSRFPRYCSLEPVPLDLDQIEQELERADRRAEVEGWSRSTIAMAALGLRQQASGA